MSANEPEENPEEENAMPELAVVPLPIDVFANIMDKLPNAEDFEPVMFEIQTQSVHIKVAKSTTNFQLKCILQTFERISGVVPEDSWEFMKDRESQERGYQ